MNKLKELRTQKGLTQKDVAAHLGIDRTTYVKYERGSTEPSMESLNKLADFFGVTVDCLFGRASIDVNNLHDAFPFGALKHIPIVGEVKAGYNGLTYEYEEGYVDAVGLNGDDYFALRVKGDSMEPDIRQGDIAIIRKQESAETGDIVVAVYDGEEATIKKLITGDGYVILQPLNSAYPPKIIHPTVDEPLYIVGVLVQTIRQWK